MAPGSPSLKQALIEMPDGMPPALLVERFDIRMDANDQRLILAMEDLCSVLDLFAKRPNMTSTIERVVCAIRGFVQFAERRPPP